MSGVAVTVAMFVKNEQKHIEEAVRSIVEQQDVAHELVVVDDGSTDRTGAILAELAVADPRIRVFKNPRAGVGKVSAANYCVAQARGDFVCLFAGDDIMPPGSLAERYRAVKDLPADKAVIGVCKIMTMSDDKRYQGHLVPRRPGRGTLSGVSPLMNRVAVARMFPIPEQLPNEDTWMEVAVLHLPDLLVHHSDTVCCHWRVHDGNSINTRLPFDEFNRRFTSRMRAFGLFLERHGDELTAESRAALEAKVRCETGRVKGSIVEIMRSGASFVDRGRAAALSGRRLYVVRNHLYGLLSGW